MDDPYTPENPTSPPDITPPVSSTPDSAAATPAEPEPIIPPAPGQVVTGGSAGGSSSAYGAGPAGGLPPQPQPVVPKSGGGKRGLKVLIIIIILALLGAGGYFVYTKYIKKAPSAPAAQSKTIPLLKIGTFQAGYGTLYPASANNEYSNMVDSQMFEGLVRYEDKSKIVPDLASNWTNPDSSTWLFTIQKGIKFHDGHTLTPADVKYSLDLVRNDPNSQVGQDFATTIQSVDVVGSDQVKITTNVPDPALLNKLNFLYILDANLPKGDEPSQAGTGPYEIKPGTKPSDTNVQMVAFNDYHGGKPTVQALDFGGSNNVAQLLTAFKNHQYNIVGPMPISQSQAAGATKFVVGEADVSFLGFNTIKPGPLQNKQVREAIRYAVNPEAIGKAADTQITPESQLIPPSIPGYNPAIAPYKQDIAKAKQLLAQAGYPNGLNLTLSISATSASNNKLQAEIVNELKQVGITVTVDEHNDFSQFIDYFSSGQAEMYEVDYSSDTLDGLDIYQTTLSPSNYSNPQLNAILDQASTATDPAKRLKLLQNAATIINQDIPVVPLYSEQNLWLMDKPYVMQQDAPSSLISVYFYKVHQE